MIKRLRYWINFRLQQSFYFRQISKRVWQNLVFIEKYQNYILKFGKYRVYLQACGGKGLFVCVKHFSQKRKYRSKIRGVFRWISFSGSYQRPIAKNAWYQNPRVEVLIRENLNPNLFEEHSTKLREMKEMLMRKTPRKKGKMKKKKKTVMIFWKSSLKLWKLK